MSGCGHTSVCISKTHQAAPVRCVCATTRAHTHVWPGLGFAESFAALLPRPPVCGASCSAAQHSWRRSPLLPRLGGLATLQTSCAPKSPEKMAQRRQGGGREGQDAGQGLGDVSRLPSCSSEIVVTRRLSREGDRGAHAPGRKDSSCRRTK